MKNITQEFYFKQKLKEVEKYLKEYLDDFPPFIKERALFNLTAGGKRLRPAFVILAAAYYKHYNDDVCRIASIMELIHMASLIHDDINDDSNLRRGQVTINAEYGNDVAVFAADYILIHAMRHVYGVKDYERVLSLISNTAAEMSKGEIAQLGSMFDIDQDLMGYYYRIERKTAILIAVCCQLGALLSGATEKEEAIFYDYGYHLGMAFQMKDDLLDILDSTNDVGKPTGKDLISGLINLPTVLLLEKEFPEKNAVKECIKNHFPNGEEDINHIVHLMHREGAIIGSEQIILNHIDKAKEVTAELEDTSITKLMRESANYIFERSY